MIQHLYALQNNFYRVWLTSITSHNYRIIFLMVKIYQIYYLGSIQICDTVLLTTAAKEGCAFHPVAEITLMDSEVDCFRVSLLQQTEEKFSEFEDTSVETSKSEMQREKIMNLKWGGWARENIQNCETMKLLEHMPNGNPRKRGKKGIFKVLMVENFPKLRTDTKP